MLALVTGASSGIGKALVTLLRQEGYHVVGAAREPKRVEGESVPYDICLLKEWILLHQPDLIIHAAGFGAYKQAIDHDDAIIKQMFQVHVFDALELAKALARCNRMTTSSRVLLVISSFLGESPAPGVAIYGASKAAITHLCQSLDFELSDRGVRVLVCCPGMVKTSFASTALKKNFCYPPHVMSAEKAAQLIYRQIVKKKQKTIIDLKYRLIRILFPFIPKKWIQSIIYQAVTSR